MVIDGTMLSLGHDLGVPNGPFLSGLLKAGRALFAGAPQNRKLPIPSLTFHLFLGGQVWFDGAQRALFVRLLKTGSGP